MTLVTARWLADHDKFIEWLRPVFSPNGLGFDCFQWGVVPEINEVGRVQPSRWCCLRRSARGKSPNQPFLAFDTVRKHFIDDELSNREEALQKIRQRDLVADVLHHGGGDTKEVIYHPFIVDAGVFNALKDQKKGMCVQPLIEGMPCIAGIDGCTDYVNLFIFNQKYGCLEKVQSDIVEKVDDGFELILKYLKRVLKNRPHVYLVGVLQLSEKSDFPVFWVYDFKAIFVPESKSDKASRLLCLHNSMLTMEREYGNSVSPVPYHIASSEEELAAHRNVFVKCCGFSSVVRSLV